MSNEVLDFNILKEYYEGDEDLILAARDTFIDNWQTLYTDIKAAGEAKETRKLADSVHALKGSCGVFWPKDLQPLLEKVEDCEDSERISIYDKEKSNLDRLLNKLVEELKVMTLADLGA